MAWYNKYRPQNFEDVIGQQLVKSVLQNSITQNKIKHGYLLSGPKGTGKTTLARIFANQLNQLGTNPEARIDIIELDAASNTGVDNIRQLIDSAQTPPFAGKYKVYIIDEVHMLSKSAMNALLKILEEPPSYLIFLLATTNPEKLLPTVLSRLTKLSLTSHSEVDIVSRLQFIAKEENVLIDSESLQLIAKRANGGQRDAINLLETLYSYNLTSYTLTETTKLLGLLPIHTLEQISVDLINQSTSLGKQLTVIQQTGIDGESFLGQWLEYLLSQSFEGQSQLDSLIIPIAEILNLRLPINTVVASLALVQAKFRQINGTQPSVQIKPVTEKKTKLIVSNLDAQNKTRSETQITPIPDSFLTNNQINTEYEEQNDFENLNFDEPQNNLGDLGDLVASLEDFDTEETKYKAQETKVFTMTELPQKLPKIEINKPNLVEVKIEKKAEINEQINEQTRITEPKNQNQNFDQINSKLITISTELIKSVSSQPNCPSILKMISPDLQFESQKENNIFISISSPMFLAQLKQSKNQEFLIAFLRNSINQKITLEITKRESSNKPKLPIHQHDEPKAIDNGQNKKSDIQSDQALSKRSEHSINSESLSTGKLFYSVYKALPEDTVGDISQVPIWTQLLDSAPAKQLISNHNSSQNRDDHLEEMFDFE